MQVSLFFDKQNNVIVNPVLLAPAGFGKHSSNFKLLQNGWTGRELADAIMEALEISKRNNLEEAEGEGFWTRATGIKSYKAFSKKYSCISIDYIKEKDCYEVCAYRRCKDGSYGVDAEEVDKRIKTFSGFPQRETIVQQVKDALYVIG